MVRGVWDSMGEELRLAGSPDGAMGWPTSGWCILVYLLFNRCKKVSVMNEETTAA